MEYNRFGLPSELTWGDTDTRTQYQHDADGVRVRKTDPGQTVVYVPGLFESRTASGTGSNEIHNFHYVFAGGRIVATVNKVQAAGGGAIIATKPWYLHTDQQGSTTVVTNPAGRRVGGPDDFLNELVYDPFGSRLDEEGTPLGHQRHGGVRLGYTGHEHEDEIGTINMKGRIYDAAARRFLTPDPQVTDPLNSQSLNRYSYAWNNPATMIDPTGFDPEEKVLEDDTGYGASPGFGFVFGGFRGIANILLFGTPTHYAGDTAEMKAALRGELPGQVRGGEIIEVPPVGDADGTTVWEHLAAAAGAGQVMAGYERLRTFADSLPVSKSGPVTAKMLDVSKPSVSIGIGGYDIDAKGKRGTGSASIGAGIAITLGQVEIKGSTTAGGFDVSAKVTFQGPSASAGGGCSGESMTCSASLGVSAGGVQSCAEACTPLIHLCATVCGGASVGVGVQGSVGAGGVSGGVQTSLVDVSLKLSYKGADKNTLRAVGASGYAKFWAVRDQMMGRWR